MKKKGKKFHPYIACIFLYKFQACWKLIEKYIFWIQIWLFYNIYYHTLKYHTIPENTLQIKLDYTTPNELVIWSNLCCNTAKRSKNYIYINHCRIFKINEECFHTTTLCINYLCVGENQAAIISIISFQLYQFYISR